MTTPAPITRRGQVAACVAVLAAGALLAPVMPPGAAQADTDRQGSCHHIVSHDRGNWGARGIHAKAKQVGQACYRHGRHYTRQDTSVFVLKIVGPGICADSTITHGFFRHLDWGPVVIGSEEGHVDIGILDTSRFVSSCYRAAGKAHHLLVDRVSWAASGVPMHIRRIYFRHHGPTWYVHVRPKCDGNFADETCGDDGWLRDKTLLGRLGPRSV